MIFQIWRQRFYWVCLYTDNNGHDSLLLYPTITHSGQETNVPLPNLLCRSPCACHMPLIPVEPKTGHKNTASQVCLQGIAKKRYGWQFKALSPSVYKQLLNIDTNKCHDACRGLGNTFPNTASCLKLVFNNKFAIYHSIHDKLLVWAKENPHFMVELEHNPPYVICDTRSYQWSPFLQRICQFHILCRNVGGLVNTTTQGQGIIGLCVAAEQ